MQAYFYEPATFSEGEQYALSAETSRHCITVLRMKAGDHICLVNGKGQKADAEIVLPHKQKTGVRITHVAQSAPRPVRLFLAVGFTKNRNRNEWLLEKAGEIGVDVLIPLQCHNSEREKLNYERMENILVAAMIQSRQAFLPELKKLMKPEEAMACFRQLSGGKVLMAHCEEQDKNPLMATLNEEDALILIGPEGDFSPEEIGECLAKGAVPVTLGPHRLRTETAAVYACTIFNQKNYAL